MARLVVLSEGFKGRACELKVDRTTIGRLEDNAFQIPEPSVSSHHCEIILRGKEVLVKDLNSTNGTYIDGDPVTEAPLKSGQILRLGQVELQLENGTPTPAAVPTKKVADHTQVISQGVKLNDLEGSNRPINLAKDSGFKKKSNKANLYFLVVGVILAVVVIVLLVRAVLTG
jgi:pSer/pThr/pTyr-binding forkhead associated (FHA) protein